jgi:hypothetical protein
MPPVVKHPARRRPQKIPRGVRPHLVGKLRDGWSYDPAVAAFVAADGRRFIPRAVLPKGTTIVHMTPDLARAPMRSLSPAERELARYIQIVLPRAKNPGAYLARLAAWECLAEVRLPPDIDLPA